MRRLFFVLVFIGTSLMLFAQEAKPDCQPKSCSVKDKKSCSPGDTKKEEAKIITTLRADLQALKTRNNVKGNIIIGVDDDHSLEILKEEFIRILQFYGIEPSEMGESKAQQIATMRKAIARLNAN